MKKILVGGCFNSVHKGHVYFLNEAKKLGDHLSIILTNDKNNRKPYAISFEERKRLLEKTNIPDEIIEGHESDFMITFTKIDPDVIVLGYDQKLPGSIKTDKEIVYVKKYKDYSTSKHINENKNNQKT